jgi:imidazole glycerol-phosphate synthase subunit HisF
MGWKVLKKRIIPVLLLKNGRMVKGQQFNAYRDTGEPVSQAKIYNAHNTDELVFLDIEATSLGRSSLIDLISRVAQECFMPLSVGGGISSLDDIRELISAGADKVIINSAAINNFELINAASKRFGKQAIIISIDLKKENGQYVIYTNSGKKRENVSFLEHLKMVEDAGAGEIIINSIDNDGMMGGYDIELLKLAKGGCSIPIVICGGAGNFEHLYEGFQNNAHAVACASLFHFGDNNPTRARSFLLNKGVAMKNLKAGKF